MKHTGAVQDHVVSPVSKTEYFSGEPRSLQEAWAAGDMAVYPYAKSLATKTSISGLVIQKEWVQSLMEPNGACALLAHIVCVLPAMRSSVLTVGSRL